MIITRTSKHIKVEGHSGTWYVIDKGNFALTPDTNDGRPLTIPVKLFLLEHEQYGDDADNIIIAEDGSLVLDAVENGFGDLEDAGWMPIIETV